MKHLMTILLFCSSFPALSGDFEKANDLYKEGLYDSAAVMYEQLINDGFVSSELYYNAGNAFYRMGDLGKSVLYLERAKKLGPGNEDIVYNLDSIVKPATLDKINTRGDTGIKAALKGVIVRKSRNFWSVSTLILFISGFIFLGMYLFSGNSKWKRLNFFSGIGVILLAMVTMSFAFIHRSHLESEDWAVIMNDQMPVYSEPSENATEKFELHEGTTIEVIEQNKSWYRIKAGNNEGWVLKEGIEAI